MSEEQSEPKSLDNAPLSPDMDNRDPKGLNDHVKVRFCYSYERASYDDQRRRVRLQA